MSQFQSILTLAFPLQPASFPSPLHRYLQHHCLSRLFSSSPIGASFFSLGDIPPVPLTCGFFFAFFTGSALPNRDLRRFKRPPSVLDDRPPALLGDETNFSCACRSFLNAILSLTDSFSRLYSLPFFPRVFQANRPLLFMNAYRFAAKRPSAQQEQFVAGP